ncbi:hypothetical protein WME91_49920 [Sorangium sp. So ce269]
MACIEHYQTPGHRADQAGEPLVVPAAALFSLVRVEPPVTAQAARATASAT